MDNKIYRIVITGGPCAGKSTGIEKIREELTKRGFQVYSTPELATIFINGGLEPWTMHEKQHEIFQENMLKTQLRMEKAFLQVVELSNIDNDKPIVILHDRGAMDNNAYTMKESWELILERNEWEESTHLKDFRYDAIIHMVTAADGAEEFYTLKNNKARTEDLQAAIDIDRRIQNAWLGHDHFIIIDNEKDFDKKVQRVLNYILNHIQVEPVEIEKKFLVRYSYNLLKTLREMGLEQKRHVIVQDYLIPEKETDVERIRFVDSGNDIYRFYHTIKTHCGSSIERIEIEKEISYGDYHDKLLNRKDKNLRTIKKDRYSLIHKNKIFLLDAFSEPFDSIHEGKAILEVELEDVGQGFEIPPFFEVIKDVSIDPSYSNYGLAQGFVP